MKIANDKKLHFFACLVIAFIASALGANILYPLWPAGRGWPHVAAAYAFGVIAALAIGIAKEARDRKQAGNHFCWLDLIADFCGALLGAFAGFFALLL